MQELKQIRPSCAVPKAVYPELDHDLVYVYVFLNPPAGTGTVDSYVKEVTNRDEKNHLAVAWVEVCQLGKLAELEAVHAVRTVTPPVVETGLVNTEGDGIHRADQVRSIFGQDGSGVKVGVISDGVDNRADAMSTGDLPADLNVLSNNVGGDEGTAILEIVYDLAPGAQLYFHDCGTNELAFNSAIDDLVAAGCKVIIDDIGWITEPFFEDGIIAQHVKQVIDGNGIVYVSSAGNSAKRHYQGLYNDDDGNNFNDDYLFVDIPPGSAVDIILQWDDKFGASGNDYDLWFINFATDPPQIAGYSYNVQEGYENPIEWITCVNTSGSTIEGLVLIENYEGSAAPKNLEVYIYPYINTYIDPYNITPQDSIFGHKAIPGVIAVGAIDYPNNNLIAGYSSQGPVTMLSGEVRSKPDVCGMAGVQVTGAGDFPSTFYGTSAAAPHVAAIAALTWAQYPDKTAAEIRSLVTSKAVDLGTAGFDYIYGNGRADALNSVQGGDTTPPAYQSAAISGANKVVTLAFSENLVSNTADLKGAVTFAADGASFGALGASDTVAINNNTLVVTFNTALTGNTNRVRIAANTLKDIAGNVVTSQVTTEAITAADITPPVYQGAAISGANKVVTLTFSENLVSNVADLKAAVTFAADGANFGALDAGDTVAISNNTLVVTFANPLGGSANKIRIAANALKDEAGNVLTGEVTTEAIEGDVTPPAYQSAAISGDNKVVTLTFSENLVSNVADLEAAVTFAADGTNFGTLGVSDTVAIINNTLVVSFNDPLGGSNNNIRIAANALRDEAGNVLTDEVTTEAIEGDITPPVYQSAAISVDFKVVTLTFSENLVSNVADLKAVVAIAADGSNFNPLGSGDSVSISNNTLIVTFSKPLGGSTNKVRIAANALRDEAGNVLTSEVITEEIAGDVTPPAYIGAAMSGANTIVTLTFSENLETDVSDLKLAVTFAADGVNFSALSADDSVVINNNTLVVTFNNPLTDSENKVRIAANTLKDEAGNVLATEVTTEPITAADITPPSYIGAAISGDYRIVRLTFNENLFSNTVDLKGAVSFAADGSSFSALGVSDTVTINNNTLVVTFNSPLGGSANKVRIAADALKDEVGNVLTSEVTTEAITGDTSPPAYQSAAISGANKVVTLTFNENLVSNVADLKGAVTFAADGASFGALDAGDAVAISNNTLVVTFANPLGGSANKIRIAADALRDEAGNVLTGEVTTEAIEGDVTPPAYQSAAISGANKVVTLTFSENLISNTADLKAAVAFAADGASFGALDAGDTVAISNNTLVVTFNTALAGNQNKIRVAANALKDAAGNILSEVVTTTAISANAPSSTGGGGGGGGGGAVTDNTPPTVTGTQPADGATGIPVDTSITLTFTEEIKEGSTYNNISIKDDKGKIVNLSRKIDVKTLILKPDTRLGFGTKYTVTVPAGAVKDTKGNDLAKDFTLSFTTEKAQVKPAPVPVGFSDMSSHWAAECVSRLAGMNIFGGYPDGTFRPDKNITRAEVTAILVRVLNLAPGDENQLMFGDNAKIPVWVRGAVAAAVYEGLIKGYEQPDGSMNFEPARLVTRAELAAMLARVIEKKLGVVTPAALNFADTEQVPVWAERAVGIVYAKDVIGGYPDNTFRPQSTATRAETASMVERLIDLIK